MAFPTNPTNGQQATVNGVIYIYSNTIPAWTVATNTGSNLSANNVTVTTATNTATLSASGNIVAGNISATTVTSTNGVILNGTYITANLTVVANVNAISVGPVITANGVQFTVTPGQRWVII